MLASGRMGAEIHHSELHMGQFGSKGGLRRMVPLKEASKGSASVRTAIDVAARFKTAPPTVSDEPNAVLGVREPALDEK